MNKNIADLRLDYSAKTFTESDADPNPINQFRSWWKQATTSEIIEPNAMTLATASTDGLPSARIVLLKDLDEKGFTFYTNYESYKAMQLAENPKACLVFHWKELERQVRIMGVVVKIPAEESNEYFHSRPVTSQVGAWASPQSRIIPGRQWIEAEFEKRKKEFANSEVPLPPHWGGYLVKPVIIEFWQGRRSRLHDRLQYTMQENGDWKMERLAP